MIDRLSRDLLRVVSNHPTKMTAFIRRSIFITLNNGRLEKPILIIRFQVWQQGGHDRKPNSFMVGGRIHFTVLLVDCMIPSTIIQY